MTRDVLVSVRGLQFADSDVSENATDEELDKIETICPGEYHYRNGGHFITYEELVDSFPSPVKSMFKLRGKEFTVTKKGPVNTQMVFLEGEKTLTDYSTPYGNIMVGIDTRQVKVDEQDDSMHIRVEYGLEVNYQYVADCDITVHIMNAKKPM